MIYLETSVALSSIEFLRGRGPHVELASCDTRLVTAARHLRSAIAAF